MCTSTSLLHVFLLTISTHTHIHTRYARVVEILSAQGVLAATACIAPALRRQHLVVHRAQLQTQPRPCVKVRLGRNRAAAGARVAALRNVLRERRRAGNRRLVDLRVLPDIIDRAITLDGADLGALSGTLAVGGVLCDVVLDKRVARPAVDGDEDGAARAGSGAVKRDVAMLLAMGKARKR